MENSRAYQKTKALGAIPAGAIIGPDIEVHVVKILDEYGLEVAIQSVNLGHNLRDDIKRN